MIRSLHVSTMRASDLDAGHEHHALFQASTIGALLEGRFDGDITVAELAERGDLGLGTLNGLDGELIVRSGCASSTSAFRDRIRLQARQTLVTLRGSYVALSTSTVPAISPPRVAGALSAARSGSPAPPRG